MSFLFILTRCLVREQRKNAFLFQSGDFSWSDKLSETREKN
ncbi:unnamed protein product [Amoebophrya sp. A25]|nr:unnamed protein product [Amoebophrya sp. A25]|eukprot:GSA25T00018615001.1